MNNLRIGDKVQTNEKFNKEFNEDNDPHIYLKGIIESFHSISGQSLCCVRKNDGESEKINICNLEPDEIAGFSKNSQPKDFER